MNYREEWEQRNYYETSFNRLVIIIKLSEAVVVAVAEGRRFLSLEV